MATDIIGMLRHLDIDQQDTLMKYLYKGMGSQGLADVNGSVLLSWHKKVSDFILHLRLMLNPHSSLS
jgi:actin related protein 2/3 complex subunit 5